MRRIALLLTIIMLIVVGNTEAARWKRQNTYRHDRGGSVIADATVAITLAGTTTSANVYEASTGGTTVTSVTTNSKGVYIYYVDDTVYNYLQLFDESITKSGYSTVTIEDVAVVVGGSPGDLVGDVTGNLTGNVTGNVTGNLTGNVTGNLTGNVTGNVVGNVTGAVTGNSDTATALAADPADCSAGQLQTGINATGVAQCTATPTVTSVTGNLTGDVTGNSDTCSVASLALTSTIADAASDATTFLLLSGDLTGDLPLLTNAELIYNSSTNTLGISTVEAGAIIGTESYTLDTDNVVLSSADCMENHAIATDAKTYTLPATIAGCKYTFFNAAAATTVEILIDTNAADEIFGSCGAVVITAAAGTRIQNTKATTARGDSITLVGDGADGWYIKSCTGVWAETGT